MSVLRQIFKMICMGTRENLLGLGKWASQLAMHKTIYVTFPTPHLWEGWGSQNIKAPPSQSQKSRILAETGSGGILEHAQKGAKVHKIVRVVPLSTGRRLNMASSPQGWSQRVRYAPAKLYHKHSVCGVQSVQTLISLSFSVVPTTSVPAARTDAFQLLWPPQF